MQIPKNNLMSEQCSTSKVVINISVQILRKVIFVQLKISVRLPVSKKTRLSKIFIVIKPNDDKSAIRIYKACLSMNDLIYIQSPKALPVTAIYIVPARQLRKLTSTGGPCELNNDSSLIELWTVPSVISFPRHAPIYINMYIYILHSYIAPTSSVLNGCKDRLYNIILKVT